MERKWPVPYWRHDRETLLPAPRKPTPISEKLSDTWYDLGPFVHETSNRLRQIFDIKDDMATPSIPVPPPTSVANTLIHDLVLTGLTAASIFVKNPQSQAQAGALISLVNKLLAEHGQSL